MPSYPKVTGPGTTPGPESTGVSGPQESGPTSGLITPGKKILYLTLYHQWFEPIATNRKKIEYRDVKPHWEKRLRDKVTHQFIQFDLIVFRVGYSRSSPTVITEHRGTMINPFDKTQYFILLGKVLYVRRQYIS